jgi:hypothetical protein
MKTITSLLSFAFCLLSFSPSAQIINVPGDYQTIQQGIDAASTWFDTVLVAPGTYYENISFNGKRITVASNYIFSEDTMDIKNTIIDGSQPSNPDWGSVVLFVSGEDTTSVLCGFTITGGTGSIGEVGTRAGGGVLVGWSGAKIINNFIEYNSINGQGLAIGGGISQGPPNDPSYIVIRNNRVRYNEVAGTVSGVGGGINVNGTPIISNNIVTYNISKNLQQSAVEMLCFSGGMDISCAIGETREIYVTNNMVANNKCISENTTSGSVTACGGVRLCRSQGYFGNNEIIGNEIIGENALLGCGMVVVQTDTTLSLCNNTIAYNGFSDNISYGGGFLLESGNALLINNLIYKNNATYGAGIYFVDHNGTPGNSQVINNTIAYNIADEDGGAIAIQDDDPFIFNSILWGNETNFGSEILGDCEVRFSDVDGGYYGEGNIDEDPEFLYPDNDDYHIEDYSPCYNEGEKMTIINSTWVQCPDYDFEGDPRPDNFTGLVDMGADEYDHHEWIKEPSTNALVNLSLFPNPASDFVKIRFTTHDSRFTNQVTGHGSQVTCIQLRSLDGKQVYTTQTLEEEIELSVSNLPAGEYFVKVQVGKEAVVKKLVVGGW